MVKAEKSGVGKPGASVTPSVVATTAPGPEVAPGYETFDPEEAQRYNRAGGHLISITARYPSSQPGVPSFRPGKRYRFMEVKEALDRLVQAQEEGS